MAPPTKYAASGGMPLAGQGIVLSGVFESIGHSQSSLTELVKALGGFVTSRICQRTKYVVSSKENYNTNKPKIITAHQAKILVMTPEWLIDCQKRCQNLDPKDYCWVNVQAKEPATASTNSKRKRLSNDDQSDVKRSRGPYLDSNSTRRSVPLASSGATGEDYVVEGSLLANDDQYVNEKKSILQPDSLLPYEGFQVYIEPSTGLVYDALLFKFDSLARVNVFCLLQVVVNPKSNVCKTWTRTGRIGDEEGKDNILSDGSLRQATSTFTQYFKEKTGLMWAKRDCEPHVSKFTFVKQSYRNRLSKMCAVTNFHDKEQWKLPECTLSLPVRTLLKIIDPAVPSQPSVPTLGRQIKVCTLSASTIQRAFERLDALEAYLNNPPKGVIPSSGINAFRLLSDAYYSTIPRWLKEGTSHPVIFTMRLLQYEKALLNSLSAGNTKELFIWESDPHIHPMDRRIEQLQLNEITALDHRSTECQRLVEYCKITGRDTVAHIDAVFRIERAGERRKFLLSESNDKMSQKWNNRRLLWHGSSASHFPRILSEGLVLPRGPRIGSPRMFGDGIYFADMACKAANYCHTQKSAGFGLLLLCEVELGQMKNESSAKHKASLESVRRSKCDSTLGLGKYGPSRWVDADSVHASLRDCTIVSDLDFNLTGWGGV